MSYELQLFDRNGKELNEGDIVRISNGKQFSFYAEIKHLEDEQIIAPFHTFSFHSFEKVDQVPDGAILLKEERYRCWYLANEEIDNAADFGNKYLIDWRTCEHLLKCWKIKKV
jgi:hypothetical protein